MKKILILSIIVISFICFGALKDIPSDNDNYKGYRKLVGYEGENLFNIYFKASYKNRVTLSEIHIKPLENMDEEISLKMPNGKTNTMSRGNWYLYFRKLTKSEQQYFKKKHSKFYYGWFELENLKADVFTKKYIEEIYLPQNYPNYIFSNQKTPQKKELRNRQINYSY